MPLGEHLRELRQRIVKSGITLLIATAFGWFVYDPVIEDLLKPYKDYEAAHPDKVVTTAYSGLTSAFSQHLSIAIFLGVLISSPVWLYQIWAFIVPGLTKKEKRTAVAFICAAVPLFFAGCALANWVLPTAVRVLLEFTPEGQWNLIPADQYLAFVTRFILAFGLAFLLPVVLVALNVAHVLPAHLMLKGWRIAVILNFVFAAMMTPTPDAWTMIALALPMCGLYFGAYGVAWLIDRRRAKDRPAWADLGDDEASPL